MRDIPDGYRTPCPAAGRVEALAYGRKTALLYRPTAPADRILYLIHGGGGDERAFFCPDFLNMIDHMIHDGVMEPMYIVSPCFYDPDETDKTPASSGRAVAGFARELRDQIIPLAEAAVGVSFDRRHRLIGGFSMGGVATWYAFMQALDLFYWFLPLSGDCWALGEKGGGSDPAGTAARLVDAVSRQGGLPFHIHAMTGDQDIAYPNLDPQIRAMRAYPELFGDALEYTVLEGGVHDYQTIFRYLFDALPSVTI